MRLQLKLLVILSLSFLLSSCKTTPQVTVCVSDPAAQGFDCYNQMTKVSSFLQYQNSDKYIALSPEDAQTLLNFCAQGMKQNK